MLSSNARSVVAASLQIRRLGSAALLAGVLVAQSLPALQARPGQVDSTFKAPLLNGAVRAMITLPDEALIIAGDFTTVDNQVRPHIAKLNGDGSADLRFQAKFDKSVLAVSRQADGKLVVGGSFTEANGQPRAKIVRLLPDGSLDPDFAPGSGLDAQIECLALQGNGGILIGGSFTNVNGAVRMGVARLDSAGSLDLSFAPELQMANGSLISSIACYPDGRLLIAGAFHLTGAPNEGERGAFLARLNADGSWDRTFNKGQELMFGLEGSHAPLPFRALKLLDTGAVLVAGEFTLTNAFGRRFAGLLRLDEAGVPDPTFAPGGLTSGTVNAVVTESDGKILCAGSFSLANSRDGPGSRSIARLYPDGALDYTFDDLWSSFNSSSEIFGLALQGNRAVITLAYSRLTRLSNVALPPSAPVLKIGPTDSSVFQEASRLSLTTEWYSDSPLFLQWRRNGAPLPGATNLSLLLTQIRAEDEGSYSVDGSNAAGTSTGICFVKVVAPRTTPGSFDLSFRFENRRPTFIDPSFEPISAVAVQPDGNIIAAIPGTPNTYFGRLTLTGKEHETFRPVVGANVSAAVRALLALRDGRLLAGGLFQSANGAPRTNIAAFLPGGTLDPGFSADIISAGKVTQILEQSDGKILLIGEFTNINKVARNRIARLHPNGSLDQTFDPGSGPNGAVDYLAVQPDGKILIGGAFSTFAGQDRGRVARLFPDGRVDASFRSNWDGDISCITVLSDGRIIISGSRGCARYSSGGLLDLGFRPPPGPVAALFESGGNKYVVQMSEQNYRGISARIIGLDFTGSLDTNFTITSFQKSSSPIGSLAVPRLIAESNGNFLLAAPSMSQNGIERSTLVRLFNQPPNPRPPVVVTPPASLTPYLGWEQHLGVLATGYPPPSYQWVLNSIPIEGATNQSFDIWRATATNSGAYSVILSNSTGVSTSGPVVLNFRHAPNIAGTLDLEFSPIFNGPIAAVAIRRDHRIVVLGGFETVNGMTNNYVAQLLPTGELDLAFQLEQPITPTPWDFEPFLGSSERSAGFQTLAIEADGKILVGGRFSAIGDFATENLARLNLDGSLDRTFQAALKPNLRLLSYNAVAVDRKGRIIAPVYAQNGARMLQFIVRLESSGLLDASFEAEIPETFAVRSIQFDANGDILAAANGLYRVREDGKVSTLSPPDLRSQWMGITGFAIQPDQKLLIGRTDSASFKSFASTLVRITTSGALDENFTPPTFPPNATTRLSVVRVQDDNRAILLETSPRGYGSVLRRLLPNGEADPSLHLAMIDSKCLETEEDGNILIATRYGASYGLRRIYTGEPLPNLFVSLENGRFVARWPANLQGFTLESSPRLNPASWSALNTVSNMFMAPVSLETMLLRLRSGTNF